MAVKKQKDDYSDDDKITIVTSILMLSDPNTVLQHKKVYDTIVMLDGEDKILMFQGEKLFSLEKEWLGQQTHINKFFSFISSYILEKSLLPYWVFFPLGVFSDNKDVKKIIEEIKSFKTDMKLGQLETNVITSTDDLSQPQEGNVMLFLASYKELDKNVTSVYYKSDQVVVSREHGMIVAYFNPKDNNEAVVTLSNLFKELRTLDKGFSLSQDEILEKEIKEIITKSVKNVEDKITRATKDCSEYKKKYLEHEKEVKDLSTQLLTLKRSTDNRIKKFTKMMNDAKKFAYVQDIEYKQGVLTIEYKPTIIKLEAHDKTWYYPTKEIRINVGIKNNNMPTFATKQLVGGHGHVHSGGTTMNDDGWSKYASMCLGGDETKFKGYLSTLNITYIVQYLHDWIHTFRSNGNITREEFYNHIIDQKLPLYQKDGKTLVKY